MTLFMLKTIIKCIHQILRYAHLKIATCTSFRFKPRNSDLFIYLIMPIHNNYGEGGGGYKTGGGGQVKFYPYEKGGGRKGFSHAEGGGGGER